jgi:acetyl-CoA carboxylase alpha subunit
MFHVTTCVHVEVFLITASSHVRTEPWSVIGHTRGKKMLSNVAANLWLKAPVAKRDTTLLLLWAALDGRP